MSISTQPIRLTDEHMQKNIHSNDLLERQMSEITLFEYAPTRSARVRWTLKEAGINYESIGNDPSVFGNSELHGIHPLGKVPAVRINNKPLFESAAICAAIADRVPDANLIAKPGTWERSLHEQWSFYVLTEMEAWFYANLMNTFILPEEQRISACVEQNIGFYKRGAAGLDAALKDSEYLVGDTFGVTDIIACFTINAASRFGYNNDFPNLLSYCERLMARPNCTLGED